MKVYLRQPFDLVHYDIWGPFNVVAINGFKYFLTLVDDSTRFTWVHMLRAKSDAVAVIPKFFRLIETQFNTKIKKFRSDNAKRTFGALSDLNFLILVLN